MQHTNKSSARHVSGVVLRVLFALVLACGLLPAQMFFGANGAIAEVSTVASYMWETTMAGGQAETGGWEDDLIVASVVIPGNDGMNDPSDEPGSGPGIGGGGGPAMVVSEEGEISFCSGLYVDNWELQEPSDCKQVFYADEETGEYITYDLESVVPKSLGNGWVFKGWTDDTYSVYNSPFYTDLEDCFYWDNCYFAVYERVVTLTYAAGAADATGTAPVTQTAVQRYCSGLEEPSSATFVLADNTFTRPGYEFAYWSVGLPDGTYNVTPAIDAPVSSLTKTTQACWGTWSTVEDFEYTGEVQDYTVQFSGWYLLEAWGAEGGVSGGVGLGGYASAYVWATRGETLHIGVGGAIIEATPGDGSTHFAVGTAAAGKELSEIPSNRRSYSVLTVAGGSGGDNYAYDETKSYAKSMYFVIRPYALGEVSTLTSSQSFKSPSGAMETGHAGDGHARISYLSSYEGSALVYGSDSNTNLAKQMNAWGAGSVTALTQQQAEAAGIETPPGFTLLGWATNSQSGTVAYQPGDTVAVQSGGTVQLYPVYQRTVQLMSGMNDSQISHGTYTILWYDGSAHIQNTPTATAISTGSWSSIGWTDDPAEALVTGIPSGEEVLLTNSSEVVYAVYGRTLTLNYDDGTDDSVTGSVPAAQTQQQRYCTGANEVSAVDFTLAANSFARANYQFVCWSIGVPGATYSDFKPGVSDTALQQTTHARWGTLSTTLFPYTGDIQTFTASAGGWYLLEAWGAEVDNSGTVAKGGYAYANIRLSAGETLYVGVGGAGTNAAPGFNEGDTHFATNDSASAGKTLAAIASGIRAQTVPIFAGSGVNGGTGYAYDASNPPGMLFYYSYGLGDADVAPNSATFVSPGDTPETGHAGDGYARISRLTFEVDTQVYYHAADTNGTLVCTLPYDSYPNALSPEQVNTLAVGQTTVETPTGFVFAGWAEHPSFSQYSYQADSVLDPYREQIHLYPVFQRAITFAYDEHATGGNSQPTVTVEQLFYGGESKPIETPEPLAAASLSSYGWEFAGWSTNTTAADGSISPGVPFSPGQDEYYATYSRETFLHYTATGNVGTLPVDSVENQYYNSGSGDVSTPQFTLATGSGLAYEGVPLSGWCIDDETFNPGGAYSNFTPAYNVSTVAARTKTADARFVQAAIVMPDAGTTGFVFALLDAALLVSVFLIGFVCLVVRARRRLAFGFAC